MHTLSAAVVCLHLTFGIDATQLFQEPVVVVVIAHIPEAGPLLPTITRRIMRLLLDNLGWHILWWHGWGWNNYKWHW